MRGSAFFMAAESFNWDVLWQDIGKWIVTYGLKFLLGTVVLILAFCAVNLFAKFVKKTMMKRGVDKSIYVLTYSFLKKGLKILLFIFYLSFVGVETAGVGGIIAALGLAIGLALQGALSNFAGGIIILLLRPFKIGDYVEVQGYAGTVDDIHMFHTILVTPDNKTVILPNGALSNGAIVNYSAKDTRRVDITFAISYDEDFERAKAVVKVLAEKHPLILKDPAPFIRVAKHGESSVDLVTRVWVKNIDYWQVNFDLLETVKKRFDEEGIQIPYRQVDVHIETQELTDVHGKKR